MSDKYKSFKYLCGASLFTITLVVGGVFAWGFLSPKFKEETKRYDLRVEQMIQNSERATTLVDRCMGKAAGSDNILSREEGIKMAKSLGYEGSGLPEEYVILRTHKNLSEGKIDEGGLYLGYSETHSDWFGIIRHYREKRNIQISKMEEYLNSQD